MGRMVYREYKVFRSLNISCSLVCSNRSGTLFKGVFKEVPRALSVGMDTDKSILTAVFLVDLCCHKLFLKKSMLESCQNTAVSAAILTNSVTDVTNPTGKCGRHVHYVISQALSALHS